MTVVQKVVMWVCRRAESLVVCWVANLDVITAESMAALRVVRLAVCWVC
jgi:hypothetical protein